MLPTFAPLLAVACGALVGFALALVGGGGSILATPLLLYVVGLRDPHLAVGTSALAVAVNAFANLLPHARAGHVRWRAAGVFAGAGALGAWLGSSLGKALDGQRLILLFALLMLVVAALMLRGRRSGDADGYPRPHMLPRLTATGLGAGGLAGFFGIGGGFLVVPGLMLASGMEIVQAIGSSMLAVGVFGLATAANYARAGLVDWPVAAEFIGGGIVGGWLGAFGAQRLAHRRGALQLGFAIAVAAMAVFILIHSL